MNNFKKAFTLAEVLITLAVIGVVSVLTIPNVVANYKTRVFTTQIQRFYNQWNNAVAQYIQDQNVDTFVETDIVNSPDNFFKKYFKVTKICGKEIAGCFATEYSTISKNGSMDIVEAINGDDHNPYCVTLNTGASVCYMLDMPDTLLFDANGAEFPNVAGRDYFLIHVDSDGDGSLGKDIIEPDDTKSVTELMEEVKESCKAPNEETVGIKEFGNDCYRYLQANSWKMDY